jgi:hypothetical protein
VSRTENPAAKLLLWCARSVVSPEASTRAPVALLTDYDWRDFIRAAHSHACLPLAWRALRNEPGVPDAVLADLHTAFDANARHNLRLAGELVVSSRHLAAAGLEAASWKGPVLAQRAYGDLSLRQFFDLDLLVRREDLSRAVDSLAQLGYKPDLVLTSRRRAEYVDRMGELELVRETDGLWVELHTAIVPSYFGRGRNTDELWTRLVPARVARADVLALDPVDELEALCVHGSKHRWERLEWIVDIALLGRSFDAADWERVYDGARQRHTRRMVDTALVLAATTCGVPFAGDVLERASSDQSARRLARLARRGLFDPRTRRVDELRFHVQMWDRAIDRVRYVASIPLTPSVADWEFVDLPAPLAPLYPLVRPVRMAVETKRRSRGGGSEPPHGSRGHH